MSGATGEGSSGVTTAPNVGRAGVAVEARASMGSKEGAAAYRHERDRHRRRRTVQCLAVVFVVALGLYCGQSVYAFSQVPPPPMPTGGANSSDDSGVQPSITFGTPVVENATCGDGTSLPVEVVPWNSSNVPVSTDGIFLELVELIDGDIDGGPAPPPAITQSQVCAEGPPTSFPAWYAVLQGPGAFNLGYYAYSQGWVFLNESVPAVTIPNGSAFVFVQSPLPAHLSFALCVLADQGYVPFDDCAQL
jgi:hypothetical protein